MSSGRAGASRRIARTTARVQREHPQLPVRGSIRPERRPLHRETPATTGCSSTAARRAAPPPTMSSGRAGVSRSTTAISDTAIRRSPAPTTSAFGFRRGSRSGRRRATFTSPTSEQPRAQIQHPAYEYHRRCCPGPARFRRTMETNLIDARGFDNRPNPWRLTPARRPNRLYVIRRPATTACWDIRTSPLSSTAARPTWSLASPTFCRAACNQITAAIPTAAASAAVRSGGGLERQPVRRRPGQQPGARIQHPICRMRFISRASEQPPTWSLGRAAILIPAIATLTERPGPRTASCPRRGCGGRGRQRLRRRRQQ